MFTRKQLQPFIDSRHIRVQKHPTEDLYIYGYTEICQYEKVWTPETMACRGLILDGQDNLVSRPFVKFFNLSEHTGTIPNDRPRVWEKYDGSLGIVYKVNGIPYIATRGSFTSEQAVKATEMLHKMQDYWFYFQDGFTYLFEIIYPQNRIVVDYGSTEELVHIATIDNKTGNSVSIEGTPFAFAMSYPFDLQSLPQRENKEGFVLEWTNGLRLKVKHDEYVRLHRLVTQVTARSIWDLLRNKQPFDELLTKVPDEFYEWVRKTKKDFEERYEDMKQTSINVLQQAQKLSTRKEQAKLIKSSTYPSIVFSMLDNKDWEALIWNLLYPPHIKPFKNEDV